MTKEWDKMKIIILKFEIHCFSHAQYWIVTSLYVKSGWSNQTSNLNTYDCAVIYLFF